MAKKKLALHWRILIGLGAGIGVGMVLNSYGPSLSAAAGDAGAGWLVDLVVNFNKLIGEIFKRALQFIAVPIILLAMILAVNSIGDLKKLGRIGAKTIGIFMCTAITSVVIGLTLVNVVKPGGDRFINASMREKLLTQMSGSTAAAHIVS